MHSIKGRRQAAVLYAILLAFCLVLNGQSTAVAEPISSIVPTYISAAGAIPDLQKAESKFIENDIIGCREKLALALRKHPNLPPVDIMMSKLFLSNNRTADGLRLLEKAVVANPNHPEAYLAFADHALGEGRFSDAALNIDKADSLKPPMSWPDQQKAKLKLHLLTRRAMIAEARSDWRGAVDALRAWIELDAKASVERRLARALFFAGDRKAAFTKLRHLESVGSDALPAELGMAELFAANGDLENARDILESRVKEAPDKRIWQPLARVRLMQGDVVPAWEAIQSAARAGDTSQQCQLLRAELALHVEEFAVAERLSNSIYQASPGNIQACLILAAALLESPEKSKRDEGLSLAKLLVRQFPSSPAAASTLGRALLANGSPKQAMPLLRAAHEADPNNMGTLLDLGRALEKQGESEEAEKIRTTLNAALSKKVPFARAPAARRWAAKAD